MTEAFVVWRRLDVPGHDACRLVRRPSGWRLEGAASFRSEGEPASLAYEVECDAEWHTQRGRARGQLGPRRVDFEIVQSDGDWHLDGVAIAEVAGCVDLDFGFTPATNLLTLRRLALAKGDAANVRSAWLNVGNGSLQPLDQRYTRRTETSYWYESPHFGYAAELDVLPSGFIRRYPGLWETASML